MFARRISDTGEGNTSISSRPGRKIFVKTLLGKKDLVLGCMCGSASTSAILALTLLAASRSSQT
eukprot:8067217-Pyramimonas_sp.AAC.1